MSKTDIAKIGIYPHNFQKGHLGTCDTFYSVYLQTFFLIFSGFRGYFIVNLSMYEKDIYNLSSKFRCAMPKGVYRNI
jgi:hypothetical protein